MAVVPDDDDDLRRISEEEDPQPPHSLTPDVHRALLDDKVLQYVILWTLICLLYILYYHTYYIHYIIIRINYCTFDTNYANYEKRERLIAWGTYSMVVVFLYCILGLAVSTVSQPLYWCGWLTLVRDLMEVVTIQSQNTWEYFWFPLLLYALCVLYILCHIFYQVTSLLET